MLKQLSCFPTAIKLKNKFSKLIIHTIQVNYDSTSWASIHVHALLPRDGKETTES